jgi:hypothetical protein
MGRTLGNPKRRGEVFSPRDEATSEVTTLAAPIGGWNTTAALAAMPPLDCVVIDNFWPSTEQLEIRKGSADHATAITGNVESLMAYNGLTRSLWAAAGTGIYNATSPGAVGASASTITNARFEYINFTNTGGSYLIAVNGVDKLKLYDGATWTNIDGTSTPAITGVATTELSFVSQHKRRVWFLRKNSLNAYYLATDAIGGALITFPMGGIFRLGGYLMAQASWTIDGGNGSDDYQVTVTSEGEAAVYRGTDPAVAANWELVGTYFLGAPVGPKCFVKYGGDLIYMSQSGVVEFSKILQSAIIGRDRALSQKIQKVISESAALYGNNFGWQGIVYPTENALLLNIPVTTNTLQYQYCMNTITKAWTRFLNWNANCWEIFNNKLFFGTAGKVCQAWVGTSDSGLAISAEVQAAFNKFGVNGNKKIELVRPNIGLNGQVALNVRFNTDFQTAPIFSEVTIGTANSALWDTGTWDVSVWSGAPEQYQSLWLHANNEPGYFQSLRLRVQTSSAIFTWASTDFVVKAGGIL